MLIKRPIYNQELKCVAIEILVGQDLNTCTEQQSQSQHAALLAILETTDTSVPLFVPFALRPLVEAINPPGEHSIILNLHASMIDTKYPASEIDDSLFSIALLIDTPKELMWVNFADYIAFNEPLLNSADAVKLVKFCHSRQRKVMAYNISKPMDFELAKQLEVNFYCGDFLFHIPAKSDGEIAANKLSLLQLVSLLHQDDTTFNTVAEHIQKDPLMSYQLLRLVNSAMYSGYQPVDSIEQAVTRLGIVHLKNWVMVLSMHNVSQKPLELIESGLIRAHMAQTLMKAQSSIIAQAAYTAGLLSVLDSLLETPMAQLIEKIMLTEDIKSALLSRNGHLGELLKTVIAYEEGSWHMLEGNNYLGQDLSEIYVAALSLVSTGKQAMRTSA